MESYQGVFKRIEKKYRVVPNQRAAVEAAARRDGAMAIDGYGRTRITSLYLDTPDRAMIARSVEKPLYKEKLRLRAYGEQAGAALMAAFESDAPGRLSGRPPLSDAQVEERAVAGCAVAALEPPDPCALTVFFGIKKKFKGIVYKRRLALSLPAAVAFVGGRPYEVAVSCWPSSDPLVAAGALTPGTRQIARELEAAMGRWAPLRPSMGIGCDREAWAVVVEDAPGAPRVAGASSSSSTLVASTAGPLQVAGTELRLTFDNCLEYLDCGAASTDWRPIIDPDESILEIKSAGPYPAWLVAALSNAAVYPVSFTKYGRAYQLAEGTTLQRAVAVG